VALTVSAGFTTEEIVELVHEFQVQRYGRKEAWLSEQGISRSRMQRWCAAVFAGDLDRGLIPRQGSDMNVPPGKRRALAASRAKEIAGHDAEVARLEARVKELEEVNAALGKAIGLLHQMSEQEPDETPAPPDPPAS
jgi:hypothetical protein